MANQISNQLEQTLDLMIGLQGVVDKLMDRVKSLEHRAGRLENELTPMLVKLAALMKAAVQEETIQ